MMLCKFPQELFQVDPLSSNSFLNQIDCYDLRKKCYFLIVDLFYQKFHLFLWLNQCLILINLNLLLICTTNNQHQHMIFQFVHHQMQLLHHTIMKVISAMMLLPKNIILWYLIYQAMQQHCKETKDCCIVMNFEIISLQDY